MQGATNGQLDLYSAMGVADATPSIVLPPGLDSPAKTKSPSINSKKGPAASAKAQRVPPLVTINLGRDHLMRRPEVERVTGLSRSSLYRLLKQGDFPTQVSLSTMAVAWLASDVDEWIASRVARSRSKAMNEG